MTGGDSSRLDLNPGDRMGPERVFRGFQDGSPEGAGDDVGDEREVIGWIGRSSGSIHLGRYLNQRRKSGDPAPTFLLGRRFVGGTDVRLVYAARRGFYVRRQGHPARASGREVRTTQTGSERGHRGEPGERPTLPDLDLGDLDRPALAPDPVARTGPGSPAR